MLNADMGTTCLSEGAVLCLPQDFELYVFKAARGFARRAKNLRQTRCRPLVVSPQSCR
jgi:hypothetical protein